jgi:predicted NAD/FAD-binding protein
VRIAVVGAGISGLGAAYLLSRAHEVELFERDARAGGHVNTFEHRGLGLDTGFIVHNEPNYPYLNRLFRELGVRTQDSEMSFSVSCGECGLEWSGRRPFAQKRNLISRRHLGLLAEVTRWLRTAVSTLDAAEGLSLGQYSERHGYSGRFRSHFLVPLTAALWSTAPERALDFPASYAIRFFDHHGMLGFGRFRWRTVAGGSRGYVERLLERFPGRVHLRSGVRTIARGNGVELRTEDDAMSRFDRVVLATHADQALRLLADPSPQERSALSAFAYTRNEAVLHTDERFLPRTRAARASWNFHAAPKPWPHESGRRGGTEGAGVEDNYQLNGSTRPTMTYYLNRLQKLDTDEHYCVTLNRTAEIDPARILMQTVYEHPLYTQETLRGQRELEAISGQRQTVFAGAHLGNGFHEDGLASGVRAAAALGVSW